MLTQLRAMGMFITVFCVFTADDFVFPYESSRIEGSQNMQREVVTMLKNI
jgi:hypothetical protein